MNDQELGILLGEIKAGVEENGRRLDRHNKVHEILDKKVNDTEKSVAVIKGKAALIALLISLTLGFVGLAIRLWDKF